MGTTPLARLWREFAAVVAAGDQTKAMCAQADLPAALEADGLGERALASLAEAIASTEPVNRWSSLSQIQRDWAYSALELLPRTKWLVLAAWLESGEFPAEAWDAAVGRSCTLGESRRIFLSCLYARNSELAWAVADYLASALDGGATMSWPTVCLGGPARLASEVPEEIEVLWDMAGNHHRFRPREVVAALSRAEVVALAQRLTFPEVRKWANATADASAAGKFAFFCALGELAMFTAALPSDFRKTAAKSRNSALRSVALRASGHGPVAKPSTKAPAFAWVAQASISEINHFLRRGSDDEKRRARAEMRAVRYPLDPAVMTDGQLRRRQSTWDEALAGCSHVNSVWDPALRRFDLRVLRSSRATANQVHMVLRRWERWAAEGRVSEFLRGIYLDAINELLEKGRCRDSALETAARLMSSEMKVVRRRVSTGEKA